MTLRLVLVSLVAAMGLTIPSTPVIESWVASTQNWMNARFADWDTRNPQTADYAIVSDFYDMERLAPRPARSSLPATAPEPSGRTGPPNASSAAFSSKPALLQDTQSATVRPVSFVGKRQSFEPIWVDEKLSLGIAYELNLKNEGIGVVPPQVVQKPAAAVRFDPIPVVRKVYRWVQLELAQWSRTLGSVLPRVVFPASSPRRFEPIVVAKNPRGGVAEKLIQLSQRIGINPAVAGAPRPALASESSFGPMETSTSLYFAGELTPPAKSVLPTPPMVPTKPSATPVAVRPPLSPAVTATRELPDDLDIEATGELVRQDDGFGAPTPAAKAPLTAATPRFEPLEVSCDYYVGTAFELNLRNDGFNIPAETVVHTAKIDVPAPHSACELNRAVKLTREAVYAWVNVFTGPALATVSQAN